MKSTLKKNSNSWAPTLAQWLTRTAKVAWLFIRAKKSLGSNWACIVMWTATIRTGFRGPYVKIWEEAQIGAAEVLRGSTFIIRLEPVAQP